MNIGAADNEDLFAAPVFYGVWRFCVKYTVINGCPVLEQCGYIGSEQLDCDGQEDDSEKLAEDVYAAFAEDAFGEVEILQNEKDDYHVEDYRCDDVLDMVFCS